MNWLLSRVFVPNNYGVLQFVDGEAWPQLGPGYVPPAVSDVWCIYIGG